jgi:type-F conjugative transfer system secretin TraK
MSRLFLAGLAWLLTAAGPAWALHTQPAPEDTQVMVPLNPHSLTRLYVQGERIQQVLGPKQAYTLNHDADDGGLYLQPKGAYRNRPLNLFLKTEPGAHYSVRLQPTSKADTAIALQPTGHHHRPRAAQWEHKAPYEATLVQLIRGMRRHAPPAGFQAQQARATETADQGTVQLTVHQRYSGDHLIGEIITVTNRGHARMLKESLLYRPGDRALSLVRHGLKHGQSTTLYRVRVAS